MKRYAFGVFAVALAIGFSSFGTSNNVKKNRLFFAVKDGSSFKWELSQPDVELYSCVEATTPYCQIEVADTYTPINGQVPAPQDLISHTSNNSQYELIP